MTDIVISESYNTVPVAKTVVRGEPVIRMEKVLTGSAKAGYLMQIDGTDYKAKAQASGYHPCGWLSFEATPIKSRPESMDTAMVSGDVAGIVAGGNFELYAWVTGSTSEQVDIKAGDYLTGNNDGTLTVWSPNGTVASSTATNPYPPVAIAMESFSIASAATAKVVRVHVKSLI